MLRTTLPTIQDNIGSLFLFNLYNFHLLKKSSNAMVGTNIVVWREVLGHVCLCWTTDSISDSAGGKEFEAHSVTS